MTTTRFMRQMSIFAKYLLQIFDMVTRADAKLTKDFRHVVSKRNPRHTTSNTLRYNITGEPARG